MRRHDQGVGGRIGTDSYGLGRLLLVRTAVVGLAQRQGEISCVCGSDLEDPNRRKCFIRSVDGVDDLADDLVLADFGGDENCIHLWKRLDDRSRAAERRERKFISEQFGQHLGDLGRVGMLKGEQTNVERSRLCRLELCDHLTEPIQRFILADRKDCSVDRVNLDFDLGEIRIAGGLFLEESSRPGGDLGDIPCRDLEHPQGSAYWNGFQISEDLFDLPERKFVAGHDEGSASRLELNGDLDRLFAVHPGATQHPLTSEILECGRDLGSFAADDVPGLQ